MQKLALVLGGLVWALICFYGGLWLTFPGERAAERAAWEVQEASGGAWQLQVGDVKPWRGSGASLTDVQLLSVSSARHGEEPLASLVLRADSISAREELLPLLGGSYMTALSAQLYGGELSGRVGQDDQTLVVELAGEDLDLSDYPFEGDAWSLDLAGLLQADVDLSLDQEDIKASEGKIDLRIKDMVLSGVNFSGFTLDQAATFSKAHLRLKIADGRAEVKKGAFKSDLVEVEIGGDIALTEPLSRSRLNLTVSFTLADEIDQLAKLALKGARDDDGRYHFKASGTLGSPRFREDRVAARGPRSSSRRSPVIPGRSPSHLGDDSGASKKDDNGGFRDGRVKSDLQDRRRAGDERRLPERRRPDLRDDRQPFEPELPANIEDEHPSDQEDDFRNEGDERQLDDLGYEDGDAPPNNEEF